jgi:hypothetical protein
MIRVNFICDQFSVTDGVVADQPFMTVEEPAALTFRELVAELRGYAPDGNCAVSFDDTGRATWIMRSVHLSDPRRARYWNKALRYVQG